jgi:hypothetical protein
MGGSRKPPRPAVGGSTLPVRRNATRDIVLAVCVSVDERALILAQAAAHGRSVSGYLRDLALDEEFRRRHRRYVGHLAAKLAGLDARFTQPGEAGP